MENYNPSKIEPKWQEKWEKDGIYKDYSKDKKFYALDMFPYPSGDGLHVGHPKGYIATDVVSRFKILNGFSVIHPMGWDAFGLPAENYAIKNKIHPKIAVEKNIATFKNQLKKFGPTYDWDREINTTDPDYYKWTQWIFLKMFEKGLAYESEEPVNWCPKCKTVLANEDLENGNCERCGTEITQKKLRQWVLRMTDYADRLLKDLDSDDLDWEDLIKEQQKNWIGRSEGVEFEMKIKDNEEKIEVYTTRIDTVFGMTYAVVAPEHLILNKLKDKIENYSEVEKYITQSQNKTELERIGGKAPTLIKNNVGGPTGSVGQKTGVELQGIKVINPFNKKEISLYVADYVLGHYGTGAVMAVPAHDERDFEFAKKNNIEIIEVIKSEDRKSSVKESAYTDYGLLINSNDYSELTSEEAKEKMADWLEKEKIGKKKVNYKMRDWVFSRQRYWGEPIPIVHCDDCGGVALPESELPLELPEVENYEPTDSGESPLANITDWVNTTCPKCGKEAKRETNTMPQWAGSCWYYLRYIDPKNREALIDKNQEKEWMPVDLYVGGAEHATRHLLYARFWHKFLFDIGVVSTKEPFKKLVHVGLINAEDGRKMSKRWKNVINPDDIISEFGADAFRLYEMFMGPFVQNIAWSTKGVIGTRRFLDKLWNLQEKVSVEKNEKIENILHKTIKKVGEDIENFRFNTAVSQLMILANAMEKEENICKEDFEKVLIILSPFAPHFVEELWSRIGKSESIFKESWPEYDEKLIKDEEFELIIQISGKVRDKIKVKMDISEDEAKELAMQSEKVKLNIQGKEIRKVVFVKNRLINIVV